MPSGLEDMCEGQLESSHSRGAIVTDGYQTPPRYPNFDQGILPRNETLAQFDVCRTTLQLRID